MPVVINGSTGISGVDGSAGTPAVQGSDTNTGVFFPAADTIAFGEGGTEVMRINSSGNVGIGTSSPAQKFDVRGGDGTGGISGSGGTWAAQVIMNQDASGYGGLSVQNRWTAPTSTIFEAAKGYNGATIGYYPVFSVFGDGTFGAAISGGNTTYPAFFPRAWVNFNGTGTVAIRASGNVSSITDHGTGDYTVNFVSALVDASYAVNAIGDGPVNGSHCGPYVAFGGVRGTYTASAFAVAWFNPNNSAQRADPGYALISVFR